jgi:hypothetical protein
LKRACFESEGFVAEDEAEEDWEETGCCAVFKNALARKEDDDDTW